MLSLYLPRLASIGLRRTRYQPAVEGLESRRLLVVDPLIAEFQAINDATLVDEDGRVVTEPAVCVQFVDELARVRGGAFRGWAW